MPRDDAARPPGLAAGRIVLTCGAGGGVAALVFAALLGCRPAPAAAEPARTPESRSTAMPESLRCRQAAECVQRPSCYWEAPACVTVAAAREGEECGDDADPRDGQAKVACDCFEGQCVPR